MPQSARSRAQTRENCNLAAEQPLAPPCADARLSGAEAGASKRASADERANARRMRSMEYYSAVKRRDVPMQTAPRKGVESAQRRRPDAQVTPHAPPRLGPAQSRPDPQGRGAGGGCAGQAPGAVGETPHQRRALLPGGVGPRQGWRAVGAAGTHRPPARTLT